MLGLGGGMARYAGPLCMLVDERYFRAFLLNFRGLLCSFRLYVYLPFLL